jgi:DNA-directed RNA polymerase specialized sigma24 family protein
MRHSDGFDKFYAGSVRRVTSYLYTVTGSRAEAEDAAQELAALGQRVRLRRS